MLRNAGHLESVKKLRIKEKDLAASQDFYQVIPPCLALKSKSHLLTIDCTSKSEGGIQSSFKPVLDTCVMSCTHTFIVLHFRHRLLGPPGFEFRPTLAHVIALPVLDRDHDRQYGSESSKEFRYRERQ